MTTEQEWTVREIQDAVNDSFQIVSLQSNDVQKLLDLVGKQKALIDKADFIIRTTGASIPRMDWRDAYKASGLFGDLDEKSPKEHK